MKRIRDKLRRVTGFGWASKVYGGLFFVLIGLFMLAHLIPGVEEEQTRPPTPREKFWLGVFCVAIVGLGVGVLWEYVGGTITTVAMLIWFYIEMFTGPNPSNQLEWDLWPLYLILLGGILHILSGTRLGRRPRKVVPKPPAP